MVMNNPTVRGSIWMLTGFLACPCHLPVTIPIILGLTAGTAFAGFLANNLWVVGAISTVYFLVALVLGFSTLKQNDNVNIQPVDPVSAAVASGYYTWVKVQTTDGTFGWVAENFLATGYAPTTPA